MRWLSTKKGDLFMRTRHIVRVCCSDGSQSKPKHIRGCFVHEIRDPGGVLFPNLYAHKRGGSDPTTVAELQRIGLDMLFFKVDTMVEFKSPDEIVLMPHGPCAAGIVLGMTTEEIQAVYLEREDEFRKRYPDTLVYTFFEEHSPCGNHRKPHVRVTREKIAA